MSPSAVSLQQFCDNFGASESDMRLYRIVIVTRQTDVQLGLVHRFVSGMMLTVNILMLNEWQNNKSGDCKSDSFFPHCAAMENKVKCDIGTGRKVTGGRVTGRVEV